MAPSPPDLPPVSPEIDADPSRPTAAPSSPPRRAITLPPETLILILSFASDSLVLNSKQGLQRLKDLGDRNAYLSRLALVSHAFQAAAYSVLYGDLRLAWMADKAESLLNSFIKNSNLLPLVRRLDATAVDIWDWVEHTADNPNHPAKARWLAEYCERKSISQTSLKYSLLRMEYGECEDGPDEEATDEWEGEMRNEWKKDMRKDALQEWDECGHGWKSEEFTQGALELLDLIDSAPALRTLVVRGFMTKLRPTTIAKRGPYPLIEALETPDDNPFFANRTLAPLLASWTPNLRSLSGTMQEPRHDCRSSGGGTTATSLPPSLTRLEITSYDHNDSRINTLLLQAQPSLRSLKLVPARASPGWASSPTILALLSSLETLIVDDDMLYHNPDDVDALILALPSSSLRHLELVPASLPLFTSLPPSLQSISLSPTVGWDVTLFNDMEQVLGMLKKAATPPLRVEFAAPLDRWSEAIEARNVWTEDYVAEGHTLATRYIPRERYF